MAVPEIDALTRVLVSPNVIAERVLEETVVLDLDTDAYARLNPTGGWLWERLATPQSVGELADALVTRFSLERPRALADVTGFVRDLSARGLVELPG